MNAWEKTRSDLQGFGGVFFLLCFVCFVFVVVVFSGLFLFVFVGFFFFLHRLLFLTH